MFKIVVRSHARSQTILDQTLALLRQQQDLDLSRSLYLALHREDVPDYERVLKDYPHAGLIIGNERGGHSRTNDACDYFPEGEPLLFMDDDGSPAVEWPGPPVTTPKRPWTNLSRYASDAFATIDKGYAGAFGFCHGTNPARHSFYWKGKTPFKDASHRPVVGNFWGAYNDRAMIKTPYGHQDDNIRTARYMQRYGNNLHYHWIGMRELDNNPGGMQSPDSGDRGNESTRREVTKTVCETILRDMPEVATAFEGHFLMEKRNYHSLRFRPRAQLQRMSGVRQTHRWSTYFAPEPDEPT